MPCTPDRPRRTWSAAVRTQIAATTNNRCAYCGTELTERFPLDHVEPMFRGGADEPGNLVAACRSCNHYKSTFTVEEFRHEITQWTSRLERDSVTFKNALRYALISVTNLPVVFYAEQIGLWGGEES